MIPSNIQPDNLAIIGVDRHGERDYPEAQSSGSFQSEIVPDGVGKVPNGIEEVDDQWNDREPNGELLALDGDVEDEDSDPYLATDRGGGEVSWAAVKHSPTNSGCSRRSCWVSEPPPGSSSN